MEKEEDEAEEWGQGEDKSIETNGAHKYGEVQRRKRIKCADAARGK